MIEQAQPAAHLLQRRMYFALALLQRNCFQARRNRNFTAHVLLQELLIEALYSRQDSQFPLRIFRHLGCHSRRQTCGMR